MINSFILQCRLTKDVEYGTTNSGVSYANFSVAWNEKYNENEQQLFMNCKAWRGTADLLNKYFKKGDELVIEGKLVTETYEKDGQNKSSTRMVVDRVHFTYGKKNNDNQEQGQEQKQELTPVDDETMDNLPF